jgi:RNA polymerase sigma factor (sigma-70 family)
MTDFLDSTSYRLSDLGGLRFLIGDMNLTDSVKLLRNYAEHGDETAFRELVERYVDFVYSTAFRRVGGDANLAQDVTQRVFADLAIKSRELRKLEYMGGWLHRHTGFIASNMVRSEQRRQIREQEAVQMNAISESSDSLWQQLEPVLDETIEQLDSPDRQAILLRFFERRDFRSVGNALGISDDAAQKRVSRAIEKLRSLLSDRGVTLSVVLLSALLAGRVINAAPVGLMTKAARFALAGAGAGGGGLGWALVQLAKSFSFKILAGGAVVVAALWLCVQHRSHSAIEPLDNVSSVRRLAGPSLSSKPALSESSIRALVPQTSDIDPTGQVLLLKIVAADSGKPIPDVEIDYWPWNDRNVPHGRSIQATRFGVCKVPVLDGITELSIVTRRDGFADTLLDWHTDQGEQIPAEYTLRLARAVSIGGRVVDPDGNPVAGAQVEFNNNGNPALQEGPQNDDFGWPFWITTTTDSQGHWQINRIGKEAVQTVYGNAAHSDFVPSTFVGLARDPESETQLLAGTYIFTLGRGFLVQGVVTNTAGQPVANASVLIGNPYQPKAVRIITGNDGSFSVHVNETGRNLITAQADGYGATTIEADLTGNNGPFAIVLRPPKLLKLRVMDQNGNPVPGAFVMLNPMRDNPNVPGPPPVAVRFREKADSAGRIIWSNAPDSELNFIVNAEGYMVNRDIRIHPDGAEHLITLAQGLTVSGTVSDTATGQPIQRFRVIAGWPGEMFTHGSFIHVASRPHWSDFPRDWRTFGGGKFRFSYDTPMYVGGENPGYLFKFEAQGYAPFVTRIVKPAEGSVHFDIKLAPAAPIEITVISSDQRVAAGVDVGLVSEGAELKLTPGGISSRTVSSGVETALFQTDDQGHFTLPPDPAISTVVLASPSGYAQATPSELAANPVIQLEPWGRVEGTFMINGKLCPNRTVSIGFGQSGDLETISCDWDAFKASTDAQGRFTIPMAPPGNHEMTLIAISTNDIGQITTSVPSLQPVKIAPGTNTVIAIDTADLDLPEFMLKKWGLDRAN